MKTFLMALSMMVGWGLAGPVLAGDDYSVTPKQVWEMTQEQGEDILFVDVRDPVEIMFIGFTDAVDANIPFLLVDRSRFSEDRGVFAMDINPDFVADIEAALAEKGLNKESLIVTMCRSGSSRGKPSAEYLRERGFPNVKYINHGFQGSAVSSGEMAGFRVKNGWQNAGLPWSMNINPEKIYRP
ncbi:rhodanese-related sulfurtransferase [Tamilnaduibacter salinus]|uniref:Sulfurtransferase n=1 Tax=Tamilnaduibacter salinus TaxID=1484056 RepID=A0A2A2HZF7_9GAMM|nr:rhodanese-like domain-containing protein [Tamilnaduibacter salinus]PAV24737.1 sulfurtransferase [Tamilnaduibacter salinus]PVY70025.1 rhodanese-related sulfurtransferase [Tamilnaduibacter salinus]